MSGRQPHPADPIQDGAFRYSFLALFDEEDAHHLHQAGVILAQAAIAGDPEYDPVDRFQVACRDARALRVYLQEVRDLAREDEDPRAAAVVEHADHWQRQLEDLVAGSPRRSLPSGPGCRRACSRSTRGTSSGPSSTRSGSSSTPWE